MKHKDYKEALKGHPHASDILALLEEPIESLDSNERRNGYVVNMPVPEEGSEGLGEYTVHRLAHWNSPRPKDPSGKPLGSTFDPLGFLEHEERLKRERACHGLGFLQKPDRHGNYDSLRPSTRKKVIEAYRLQVATE